MEVMKLASCSGSLGEFTFKHKGKMVVGGAGLITNCSFFVDTAGNNGLLNLSFGKYTPQSPFSKDEGF